MVGAIAFLSLASFFILLEVVENGDMDVQTKEGLIGDKNAQRGFKALKINGTGFFRHLGQCL